MLKSSFSISKEGLHITIFGKYNEIFFKNKFETLKFENLGFTIKVTDFEQIQGIFRMWRVKSKIQCFPRSMVPLYFLEKGGT